MPGPACLANFLRSSDAELTSRNGASSFINNSIYEKISGTRIRGCHVFNETDFLLPPGSFFCREDCSVELSIIDRTCSNTFA